MAQVAVLIVLIVVFLLIREVWCWYYKSNAILEKLKKIEADIEYLKNKSDR